MLAWWIGRRGGRSLVARHGHWLHVTPARLARTERWVERHGPISLLLGRLAPLIRSFISISAGVLGVTGGAFAALTVLPALIWCFGFAAAGLALGTSWRTLDHSFRYVDYVVLGLAVVLLVALIVRVRPWRRRATAEPERPER